MTTSDTTAIYVWPLLIGQCSSPTYKQLAREFKKQNFTLE